MSPCKIAKLSQSALADKRFLRRPDLAVWKDACANNGGEYDASGKHGLLARCAACSAALEEVPPGSYARCPDCGGDLFLIREFQAEAKRNAAPARPPYKIANLTQSALADKRFLRRPDLAMWKDIGSNIGRTYDASAKHGLLARCAACCSALEEVPPGSYARCPDCGGDLFLIREFQAEAKRATHPAPSLPKPASTGAKKVPRPAAISPKPATVATRKAPSSGSPRSARRAPAATSPVLHWENLSMWQHYKRAWTFPSEKRASLSEFHKTTWTAILISLLLGAIAAYIRMKQSLGYPPAIETIDWKDFSLSALLCATPFALFQLLVIGIPLWVRRLHDINRSGKELWIVVMVLAACVVGVLCYEWIDSLIEFFIFKFFIYLFVYSFLISFVYRGTLEDVLPMVWSVCFDSGNTLFSNGYGPPPRFF